MSIDYDKVKIVLKFEDGYERVITTLKYMDLAIQEISEGEEVLEANVVVYDNEFFDELCADLTYLLEDTDWWSERIYK